MLQGPLKVANLKFTFLGPSNTPGNIFMLARSNPTCCKWATMHTAPSQQIGQSIWQLTKTLFHGVGSCGLSINSLLAKLSSV